MTADLPSVELFGECLDRRGLSESRIAIEGDRALGVVTVLGVAVEDVPQILVQRSQLRCLERSQVVVPVLSPLLVDVGRRFTEAAYLALRQQLGGDPLRGFGTCLPSLFAGEGQVVQMGLGASAGRRFGSNPPSKPSR